MGEGRTNIIPDIVQMEGTVRTYSESWRREIHQLIVRIATGVAESMGATCEVRIAHGYPFLNNDPGLTGKLQSLATEYLGPEHVKELDQRMTAEDFAYFAEKIPSCLYRLGIANESRGISSNLHSATFDVDEQSLETGMGLMAWVTVGLLGELKIENEN
jgi:metal-dependent amidase/aminoacylase/carboxypeptidase family protein